MSTPQLPAPSSGRLPQPAGTVVPFPVAPLAAVQGTLALVIEPRREPPALRPERSGTGADTVEVSGRFREDFDTWATRFAQAVVEIVGGDRPVTQLLRWTSTEVYDDLTRRAHLVARAGGHEPGAGRVQPVRPRVAGVHTCFLDVTRVEVAVHVRYGHRSRAIAGRFERRTDRSGDRWVCTALEFA